MQIKTITFRKQSRSPLFTESVLIHILWLKNPRAFVKIGTKRSMVGIRMTSGQAFARHPDRETHDIRTRIRIATGQAIA